ncbi:MAG: inositol monophosphatase family protein [Candidatus Omnitrophota bacterium]
MRIDLKSAEAQFALELIQAGSELARRIRAETSIRSILKPDHSPVTLADMSIQALAGALLERYLPEAVLVAEEDTDHLKAPGGAEDLEKVTVYTHSFFPQATPGDICRWIQRGQGQPTGTFWTLDPIDGTKGFLRGGPPSVSKKIFEEGEVRPSSQGGQYVTALAFIRNGKVELAAIGCPELELQEHKALGRGVGIFAARGQGCWAAALGGLKEPKNWVRLEVSRCREIGTARVLDSFDPEHKNVEKDRRIRKELGIQPEPIVLDSMAKHVVLASGGGEIFFRTLPRKEPGHREKIWDVAPGALAIEEAGGRVTDLEGRELDFSAGITLARNPGFVATNGLLHEVVLQALQQATQS